MTIEIYAAFVIAATLLITAPGPSMMVVISHAMSASLRRSLFTIAGEATSHALFISITTLGLAPILMASAQIFFWIKWIGAAYLIWMGIRQWRAKPVVHHSDSPRSQSSGWTFFLQGFAVNTTNPKALVFYAAFFPPFLNRNIPVIPQLVILGTTFLIIFVIISFLYALVAARTRTLFSRPRHLHIQNRITGGLLIGAGLALAAVKKR